MKQKCAFSTDFLIIYYKNRLEATKKTAVTTNLLPRLENVENMS